MGSESPVEIFPSTASEHFLSVAVQYWEKKRLAFNIIIALTGILSLFFSPIQIDLPAITGIIIWGLVANALYCAGFVAEAMAVYYFRKRFFDHHRLALFFIGTCAYVIATFIMGFIYSMPIPD